MIGIAEICGREGGGKIWVGPDVGDLAIFKSDKGLGVWIGFDGAGEQGAAVDEEGAAGLIEL